MKKVLVGFFKKFINKMKLIFKILFLTDTITEQSIGKSTLIFIAPANENSMLLSFFNDKNNVYKTINTYIERKHNLESKAKIKKKKITINVKPSS